MQLLHNRHMDEIEYPFVWPRLVELIKNMTDKERGRHLKRLAHVEQPTISRWRTGKSRPGPVYAKRIAKKYKINAEWLREEDAEKFIASEDGPIMRRIRQSVNTLPDVGKEEMALIAEMKARLYKQ